MMSDGRASTYKGVPNFGMVIDMREKFELEEI